MEGLVWDLPWVPARLEWSRGGRDRSLARLSRAHPQGWAEGLTWQFARRMHPRTSSPRAPFVRSSTCGPFRRGVTAPRGVHLHPLFPWALDRPLL